ncbi:hypothetical protein [Acetobacterium wieringae]|uniref:Clostridial hydrophobic W n=1 Tax=Acetobacterium wieringae TaxID=52694 RepID=A0A1F2PBT4_9FIRM|nr:hypothetical protein [Acetobacterium wieringae]OFV68880.1 clostridial hydrophobic W [Acetobacterium wieringae]URN85223.1 hypothetical protein CHL1_000854 [Acetobacterium wieringae]
MKKITVSILTTLLMLSMVFSSSVFAAEKEQSAWDSFLGLFSAKTAATSDVGVEYRGHIQNVGNYPLDGSWIQGPTELGTEGKGLRLEGFWIQLDGDVPADAHIEYQVHVQNVGWMDPVQDGEFAGTEGRSLQIEAIKISLVDDEGVQLEDYSVVYSGHVQNIGDVGPFTNGEQLGTVGSFLRLEAIEVEIVQNPADLTEYNAALAAVTQADYTAASWTTYQAVVNANKMTEDNLQSEVDAATANITAAQANLVAIPKVVSVAVPNAKQLVVTFNKAMDKTTLLANTTTSQTTDDYVLSVDGSGKTVIGIAYLDAQIAVNRPSITGAAGGATGALSADGKTLTITLPGAEFFKDRYTVTVGTPIKDTTGLALPAVYTANINVTDTARPTLVGVTYTNFQIAKVSFSEPLAAAGTVTYALPDGTAITTPVASVDADGKIQIDLTGIAATDVNKNITATIIGATDYAGNVISPNPITVTVIKNTQDTTKPTVSSVTVTSNTTFDIKFSEALISDPTIAPITASAVTVVKDINDATVYHATVAAAKTGLQTVSVTAFSDLSNNAGDVPANKVVNFSADTAAPTITSSKVEKIDGIEYLVLTYNKNVTANAGVTINGSYVDNYVTTPMPALTTGAANTAFALYKPVDGKSMSVQLELTTLTKAAEYTVTLPAALVTDLFGNNNAEVTNFKFTRTSNASTSAPKLDTTYGTNGVLVVDNNTIRVQFDRPVAGASALTLSNYALEGTVLESVTLQSNTTNGLVELKIAKDSNTLTGSRTLTVSGVTSQTGDVMATATVAVALNENVRPTVKTAQVTTTSVITLTTSEDINPATIAAGDFEVYVGGNKVTTAVTAAAGGTAKQITLTLAVPLTATDLSAGVVIKPATGITTADTVGNVLNLTQITVTQ